MLQVKIQRLLCINFPDISFVGAADDMINRKVDNYPKSPLCVIDNRGLFQENNEVNFILIGLMTPVE